MTTACYDEPTAPQVDGAYSSIAAVEKPFYYHQGERIYLDADPSRVVVSTRLEDSRTEVRLREILNPSGDEVSSGSGLIQAPGHRIVTIQPAAGRTIDDGVAALRAQQDVRFASRIFRTEAGNEVILVDKALVAFKQGTPHADVQRLAAEAGTRVVRNPMPDSGRYHYDFAYLPQTDPLEAVARLDQDELVEWAAPDMISDQRVHTVPSDGFYPLQYYLNNSVTRFGIPVDINVEPAWDITTGDEDMLIAIVDDGVDIDFTTGVDYFMTGVGGYDAVCHPHGCGLDDDYDAPFEDDRHGTTVSGMILAAHNGSGIAGIAPATRNLYIVRIFRGTAVATVANIAIGINSAWQLGAAVISNSWGGGAPNNALTAAIDSAAIRGRNGLGAVVVFSAGNTSNRSAGMIGAIQYPATLPNVIAVGSINRDGFISDYSPRGIALDMVAPSSNFVSFVNDPCDPALDVVSTDPFGSAGCNDGPDDDINYTTTFGGTSAAAPQVAGVAALVIAAHPSLTRSQVAQRIYDSADNWGGSNDYGHGKLNAYAAVYDPPPLPLAVSVTGPDFIQTKGTYMWEAMTSHGTGSYTYQWRVRHGSGSWMNAGTSQTQSMVVSAGDDFRIEVTVWSGSENATDGMDVRNCIGQVDCGPPI